MMPWAEMSAEEKAGAIRRRKSCAFMANGQSRRMARGRLSIMESIDGTVGN